MKRIVNGKRYNTDTATLVAECSNHYYPTDFKYVNESLYLTKSGAWFLVGEGGALSKYAQRIDGNSYCEGGELSPLTDREALEWLEEHRKEDEIEEYFQSVVQDA